MVAYPLEKPLIHLMFLLLQLEACAHPFFNDLRDPDTSLPNGRAFPALFDFSAQGKLVISHPFYVPGERNITQQSLDPA